MKDVKHEKNRKGIRQDGGGRSTLPSLFPTEQEDYKYTQISMLIIIVKIMISVIP